MQRNLPSTRENVTPRLALESTNALLENLLYIMADADARFADRSLFDMPSQDDGLLLMFSIDPFFKPGGMCYDRDYESSQIRFKTIVYLQCWQRRMREWFCRIPGNPGIFDPNYTEYFRPKEVYLIIECAVQFYLSGEPQNYIEIIKRDFDILEQSIDIAIGRRYRSLFKNYLVLLYQWRYPDSQHPDYNTVETQRVMEDVRWMRLRQCGFWDIYDKELFPIKEGYVLVPEEEDDCLVGNDEADSMITNPETGVHRTNLTRYVQSSFM